MLYTPDQKAFVDGMPVLEGHEWDGGLDYTKWKRGDGVKIDQLKDHIKEALEESQGLYCAYCGMRLKLTSNEQIEHIAPKGKDRYKQFMFHSSNLTLACSLCNGFEKKEKKEHFRTIGSLKIKYEDCIFNIVHPYFDDPSLHLKLGITGKGVTISSLSLKGQKSIAVFKLDEEPQTNGRWHHYLEYIYDIDPKFRKDFEDSCSRSGIIE